MPYSKQLPSFVGTRRLSRLVRNYLTDEDYALLQLKLAGNPSAGRVIPGSGGVRKLRWPAPGRGKRGGYRVIYYVRRSEGEIWLLTIYRKNVTDDIAVDVLRRIREEIEDG
jgi:mRNA-degrading endonuclease RelE of RelBE toxin-antitoxin system